MESTEKNNQSVAIKTAKYPEYVCTKLYPDLKQAICTLDIFKICYRNAFDILQNIKYFDDFVLYFSWLLPEEVLEIVFISDDLSDFYVTNVI